MSETGARDGHGERANEPVSGSTASGDATAADAVHGDGMSAATSGRIAATPTAASSTSAGANARTMRSVAVFCGSTPGADPALMDAAYDAGRVIAERGLTLVYGAGGGGLMGAVSQGALDAGGEVVGFIPSLMVEREWGRHDLTEFYEVDTMHTRKAGMATRADAFLTLPGGLGTLEEIFEVWTWRTIGYHDKPVGFLDVKGFWRPLLDAVRGLADAGFIRQSVIDDAVVAPTIDEALDALAARCIVSGAGLRGGSRRVRMCSRA